MDYISRLFDAPPETRTTAIVATTVVTTLTLLAVARLALYPRRETIIRSPLKTVLPTLSKDELAALQYKPDALPGARDVVTPYGSIRVYEWGPESGPKVLMVHGISTSCQTLTPIAHALVARGCRVMLFDLFGRGFSDGVGDLPHDARLYTTQILLALASSPLPWTGTGAFRLIGYSLGGGLAVELATTYPHLVSSLVLLAPAGLIRAASFGIVARLMFQSGLVPERLLAIATRSRLQQPIASSRVRTLKDEAPTEKYVDLAAAEIGPGAEAEETPLNKQVLSYVRWMVINHPGFVPAFMSCVRYAPMTDQHETWRRLATREKGSTAILVGRGDEILDVKEFAADALPLVGGEENVFWRVLPGGHDFVMTQTDDIVKELDVFWGMKL